MKKYRGFLIIGCLLMGTSLFSAEQWAVKMSFGFLPGGEVIGQGISTNDYYIFTPDSVDVTGLGMDVELEFSFLFTPVWSLGLSFGYMSRTLSSHSGRLDFPAGAPVVGTVYYLPDFRSEIRPITLSGMMSLPLMGSVRLLGRAGVGWYFGNVECTAQNRRTEIQGEEPFWPYWTMLYESRLGALGPHLGGGIEIELSSNMIFSLEVLHRWIHFKTFSPTITAFSSGDRDPLAEGLGSDSTFFYVLQGSNSIDQGDIDYQVSTYEGGGLSLRAGIRFQF